MVTTATTTQPVPAIIYLNKIDYLLDLVDNVTTRLEIPEVIGATVSDLYRSSFRDNVTAAATHSCVCTSLVRATLRTSCVRNNMN